MRDMRCYMCCGMLGGVHSLYERNLVRVRVQMLNSTVTTTKKGRAQRINSRMN